MKVELSEEQINNLLALLGRVDIKGGEALPVAVLQQKLQQALEPKEAPLEPPEEAESA